MLNAIAAIGVGLVLLAFAIPMLLFAVSLFVFLLIRLAGNVYHMDVRAAVGSLLTMGVIYPFAYIFGSGAFNLASDIINGFIGRFT